MSLRLIASKLTPGLVEQHQPQPPDQRLGVVAGTASLSHRVANPCTRDHAASRAVSGSAFAFGSSRLPPDTGAQFRGGGRFGRHQFRIVGVHGDRSNITA